MICFLPIRVGIEAIFTMSCDVQHADSESVPRLISAKKKKFGAMLTIEPSQNTLIAPIERL